jgi:hypothetical protein
MTTFSFSGRFQPSPRTVQIYVEGWKRPVNVMKVVNHIGYLRRSKRGRALKLDISLEAFLLADRFVTRDGKEWVNMVVSIDKVLDVLEGKIPVAGICQLASRTVETEGTGIEAHA